MYLREQQNDLWGTTALSRGDLGGVLVKPQSGEVAVLPERGEKYGSAVHSPNTNLSAPLSLISAPSNDIAASGVILPGETDAYGFNLVAGQTYMFSLYGSGGTPLPDTFLYIVDNTFTNLLAFDDDGGAGVNSLITYTATYTGLHVIAVEGFSASQTGGYTLDAVQQPAVDVVPDTFAGASALTIGTVKYGFIDAGPDGPYGPGFGEVDTYVFTAQAGLFYTFEVAGGADYASDPFDLPPGEIDSVLVVYDAEGNVVALNDDISFANGDIGSRVGFFAQEGGTYYLDVFSYQPWSGGFSITSSALNPADFDPLDSINWFSASNIPLDETNTAYVYFAAAGETFGELADNGVDPLPSFGWNATEMAAVMQALGQYENVINTHYEITTDASAATFRLITTTSTQYGAYMYPNDPGFGDATGIAAFNVNSGGWDKLGFSTQNIPGDQVSLLQGGYSFETLLHEFGHGHGLAHPHDHGGGSDIMLGVSAPQDSYGVFDLNQAVYTVMSYNSSWETGPNGASPFTIAGISNGWVGTLSAFDIALLQQRYGANTSYKNGNDLYELKDTNGVPGTYYSTIWDTGGKDEIKYTGNKNARIDLTAATLDYTATGGGVMSFVTGVRAGFTIAAGVVIENATGGAGNDGILGNAAVNVLTGNDGNDTLVGRGGADHLKGGVGFDTASYIDAGSAVSVSLADGTGTAGDANGDSLCGIEALTGGAYNDTLEGDQFNNTLDGSGGNDMLYGLAGNDTINGGDGNDQIFAGSGNDTVNGGAGNDVAYGNNGDDTMSGGDGNDLLVGENGNDSLSGGAGQDTLRGGNGNDTLNGGADADTLTGNAGIDTFVFTVADGADTITDFAKGSDLLSLAGTGITWAELDSNANGKLDDADAFVSVGGGDSTLDLGAANGGPAGVNTVFVDNVTDLKNVNFIF